MSVTIDLGKKDRGLFPITFDWPIKVDEQSESKGFIFRRKRTPPINVPLVVVVENLQYGNLMCDDEKLLVFSYKGEKHYCVSSPIRVNMTDSGCPFQILLNADAIIDFASPEKNTCVYAQLSIYDGKRIYGDKISASSLVGLVRVGKIRIKLELDFVRPKFIPEVFVDLFDEEIPFSRRTNIIKIGQMRVKGNYNSSFIPEVHIETMLSLYGPEHKKISDALILGDSYAEDGLLYAKDISLNMGLLNNPQVSDAEYEIEYTGTYEITKGVKENLKRGHQSFILKRDSLGATLEVSLDGNRIAGNAVGRCLMKQLNFTIGGQLTRPYKFVVKNLSSDDSVNNAGVLVKNFKSVVHINGARLIGDYGANVEDEIVQVSGKKLQDLKSEEGLYLPNGIGKESESMVTFTFNPTKIRHIEWDGADCYLFVIIFNVVFDYVENTDGKAIESHETKHFHTTIEQRVYLEPNPEWLCVDYGSSAIVSIYDGNVLDTRGQKTSVIGKDPQYQRYSKDTLESNSAFLSSDILLHDISKLENEEGGISSLSSQQKDTGPYGQLAVCLSPTSSMITAFYNYQLPCLKMLVGRDKLPHNPNYNIRYYCKQEDEVVYVKAEDVPTDSPNYLLSVMNVFREAYHSLFRYFILPRIGDIEKVNKLVLTYPNTYTPMHLSLIRSVVRQLFPSIRFDHDCMRFVSESDAVAAYYMRHWSEYNKAGADFNQDENILVYDMGAGTLDITVLEKRFVQGRHELKIIGKLGSCKAGNYLDFIIAKVLCEMPSSQFNPAIGSTDNSPMIINERIAMKLAIKEQVKPKLGDTSIEKIGFTMGDKTYNVEREYVVNHRLFQEYIRDTTEGMISQLCSYLGGGKMKINTVLMSGRSCRLTQLQDNFRKALNAKNEVSQTSFIMLDKPQNTHSNVQDRSKLAVAEGAMTIADVYGQPGSPVTISSKRLYGNYGVAFKGIQDRWNYVELLNHKNIPAIGNDEEYYFPTVKVGGLNATNKLQLIQTYLNEGDTVRQLNSNNMDYISVMGTFNRGDFAHEMSESKELNLRIALRENDEVVLCIGDMQSVGKNPKGSDIESETSQRSFWPVRVVY